MKNTVEEANNVGNAGTPSGIAARHAKDDRSSNGTKGLSSRFSILKQVGESANTRLYLARENLSRSSDLVILKVLHHDVVKDPTELVSFLLEARAAARLSHENIIAARGAEQIGSTHFYILEHKAGAETLRGLLNQKGWLDIDSAIRLASELADALQYAHEFGILHLEIEPNKILLDSGGKVTLTGFGVDARKQFEWAHRKRSSKCSFAYLSPEQLDHGIVDQRSDLYSLGVTLYEALTDRLPFNADSAEQMRQRIASQKAQPPHLLRSEVPGALSDIVTRLISKNPSERFQDASSLKYALRELLNSKSSRLARHDQPPQKTVQQETVQHEAIQEEDDYTQTRELASEPARAARRKNVPISQQSLISTDDGGGKNEIEQSARYEPVPVPAIANPHKEIGIAEPKSPQPEKVVNEHPAPLIKTFDAASIPAPVRLALFAAILIAVVAISVVAYRERLSNKAEMAQARAQSNVNAAEAKAPALDESKPANPEGNQLLNDGQPDSIREHPIKSGAPKSIRSSRGSGISARPSAVQARRSNPRSPRAVRRASGGRVRVGSRNVYRRH